MLHYLTCFLSCSLLFLVYFPSIAQFDERQLIISNVPDEKFEAAVDLNQDGFQDIIVFRPNTSSSNPFVGGHYVKYNDGTGQFSDGQLLKNDKTEWTQITPADVDNDGRLDLAIYQQANNKVVWLRNEGGTSEFSWRFNIITGIREDYPSNKSSFLFEDIDGDDDLDFLCGCSKSWYKNDGVGEFTESFLISNDISQVLFAADLGQNDAMDVVAYNLDENIIIGYEYQSDDSWVATTLVGSDDVYNFDIERRAEPFDLDNDGDLDIAYYGIEFLSRGEIRIFRNDGDTFSRISVADYTEEGASVNFEIIDYDNNGFLDIVGGSKFTDPYEDASFTGNDKIFWFKNENGSLTAETILDQHYMLDVGRYNQDNQYDFIAWRPKGIDLLLRDGSEFSRRDLIDWTSVAVSRNIRTAELNGDDQTDFLVISSNLNNITFPEFVTSGFSAITVILSQSSGGYQVRVLNDVTSIMPESLEFADLDNDGDLDVVASLTTRITSFSEETEEWGLIWYENEGNGSFSGRKPIGNGNGVAYDPVKVFDSDGDGFPEVAAFLKVFKNNNGSFEESATLPLPVAVADLNGDGAIDIIGEERWHENDGQGNYTARSEVEGTPVDFDGDGDIDLVIDNNFIEDDAAWYENDGSGNFTRISLTDISNVQTYVDVDADGDADAVVTGDGSFSWVENMDGKGSFGDAKKIADGDIYTSYFNDTDGDGDNDLFAALGGLVEYENLSADRKSATLALTIDDADALQQDTVSIPIKVKSGFENISSLSFSLAWDPAVATYAGISATETLTLETNSTDNGQLGITWEDTEGQDKSDGSTLFSLLLVLTGEEQSSTEVSFADAPVASAVTNTDGQTVSFSTENGKVTIAESEAPTSISLGNNQNTGTVAENQPPGTLVGKFTTSDPDNSKGFVYTLVEGDGDEGNTAFDIKGDELITKNALDFEQQSTYSIRVRTTDSRGKSLERVFEITVEDVDDTNNPPTDILLSRISIDENNQPGATVGELSATDKDTTDILTFSLVGGAGSEDNDIFAISGDELKALESFDFERKSEYSIRIQVADGNGGSDAKAFTIIINDVDESTNSAPTALSLSKTAVEENQPENTLVGVFTTTDADEGDSHTYTLVGGEGSEGNEVFQIKGDQLQTRVSLDHEEQEEYSIRVQTSDGNGGNFVRNFTIDVVNQPDDPNRPPTNITLDNNAIDENQPRGTVVGNLLTEDPDNSIFTYALVSGSGDTHNDLFTISGNELRSATSFDYENLSQLSVRIQSDDRKGGRFSKVFSILVNDVEDQANRLPTDILLSDQTIEEGMPAGTPIGTLSTVDPDAADEHQYQLSAGGVENDNNAFAIDGNQLLSAATFDASAQSSYVVRVQTDDGKGGTYTKSFVISVASEGEPEPLGVINPVEDQQATVNEDFSFTIPDNVFEGTSLTITVTQADGSPLPDWLTFDESTNTLSGTPPEGNVSVTISVTATNGDGASVSDEFVLAIDGITALGDEIAKNLRIYPVPAQQVLHIVSQHASLHLRAYRLMDMQGKVLIEQPMRQKLMGRVRVDVSSLAEGVYFLELQTNKGLQQQRVLVQ